MGGLQRNIVQNHKAAILTVTAENHSANRWVLSTAAKDMHMNLKMKFQSKLELRCRNHTAYRVQKLRNLIWPTGNHLENEFTENQ